MLLQELGNVSNKIYERNLANREKWRGGGKYFENRRFQIVLCINRRFEFPSPPALMAPPLSRAVKCRQDQGLGTGRSRAGGGTGNPPRLLGLKLKSVHEDRAKERRKLHVSAPTEPIFGWIQDHRLLPSPV